MSATSQRNEPGSIVWKLRSDLSLIRSDDGWLLKDDLSGQFLLLRPAEFTVVRLLDGTRDTDEILTRLRESETRSDWTQKDLFDFLRQLRSMGLLVARSSTEGAHVPDFRPPQSHAERPAFTPKSLFQNLFRLRIRLLNPTPMLESLTPWTSLVLSGLGKSMMLMIVLAGAFQVLSRFDDFVSEFQSMDQWLNAEVFPWLMLCFVLTRWIHEFGHAIAAHRCGVQTPEMGLQLFLFFPLLYTDVTDSWNVSRTRRLRIGVAGMAAEFVVAGLAAVLWSFANPGLVRICLANIVLFCSIGTIVFNGNPFLRYDGYYLLSDLLGVPNLMQRSFQALRSCLRQLLRSGEHVALQPAEIALAMFGVGSVLTRIVIIVSISLLMMTTLSGWGFHTGGRLVAAALVTTQLAVPFGASLLLMTADAVHSKNRTGALLRLAVCCGVLLMIGLLPLPRSIVADGSLECSGRPLFTTLNGTMRQFADYGTPLEPTSTVCELANPEAALERLRLIGRRAELQVLTSSMRARGAQDADSGYAEALDRLTGAEQRLAEFEREISRSVVRSERTGFLVPPRSFHRISSGEELNGWEGVPLSEINRGAYFESGTLLGFVATPADVYVECLLTESEASEVNVGQLVHLRFPAGTARVVDGVVMQVLSPELDDRSSEPDHLSSPLRRRLREVRESNTGATAVDNRSQREVRRNWSVLIGIGKAPVTLPSDWADSKEPEAGEAEQLFSPASMSSFLYSEVEVRIFTEPTSVLGRLFRYLDATFG